MKTKSLLLANLLVLTLVLTGFGQTLTEKQYFDENKELGGDVIIKNSAIKVDGNVTYRIFEVESPEEGDYYLNAWLMASETKDGYQEYEIQINGIKEIDKISPQKSNWQNVDLKDRELNKKP